MRFKGEKFIITKSKKGAGGFGFAFVFSTVVYSIMIHDMKTWGRMRSDNPVPYFGKHFEELDFLENGYIYDEKRNAFFIFPFAFRKSIFDWSSKRAEK